MATQAVTDDTFDAEVKQSDLPVVVDFWAEWCGPCKQIGPALEELSDELDGKVKIVKVNVDDNPNSPAQLGVRGIPALFLFKGGEVVSNKTGAAPRRRCRTGSKPRSEGFRKTENAGAPLGALCFSGAVPPYRRGDNRSDP